jgi:hypothetical protein
MTALEWIPAALVLGTNVHAVAALVIGFKQREAAFIGRLARRCWISALGLALLTAALTIGVVTSDSTGVTQADRARHMSMTIALTLYNGAFTAVACLLPVVAAVVLQRRARRVDGA